MSKPHVVFVLGTRPEAIKCAPVIITCQNDKRIHTRVLVTSQHRQLQDEVLSFFGIQPDADLNLMREKPDLVRLVQDAWGHLAIELEKQKPDMLLVQGDTTTAFIAALSAQYHNVPVAHIEAGLRTFDKTQPFPEEINRRLISHAADLHFTPTVQAKANLLREGIPPQDIIVTGNSGIDALKYAQERIAPELKKMVTKPIPPGHRLVLVTCHRRENWGENLLYVCSALRSIKDRYPNSHIIFLVHPNPNVKDVAEHELKGIEGIELRPAVTYPEMVALLTKADVILTDSGGIQEEAPSIGKPVLVLRNTTERMETVGNLYGNILTGTNPTTILESIHMYLSPENKDQPMVKPSLIYGDGNASTRIHQGICSYFGLEDRPQDYEPLPG